MFRGNWRSASGGGGGGTSDLVWATATAGTFTFTGTTNAVKCDVSSTAITVQLPLASSFAGKIYTIKHTLGPILTNPITITSSGGSIDGLATIVVSQTKSTTRICSDGTDWQII